ncbi:uncharacterized protein LOC130362316 isoform X2 [Hyla sarda]|uniref:uncharacterized protein LOC130362316 isoform X2 n=1 Tax=Hyla sarda TaxID=327740 RepID=UPI0024C215CF|nr:uncharacterized protein LOC130362316 isoform X2 [Hyla sarda]
MKSIGADTLFLSVLILVTALSKNVSRAVNISTTTVKPTSSENGSTPTSPPALSTTRPSDVTKINLAITPDPADNQTKNATEAITKVSTTTDQNLQANASNSVITNVNLTTVSSNYSTPNYVEVQPTDGNIKVNSSADQDNLLKFPEVSSDAMPTERKDILKDEGKDKGHEEQPTTSKSKNGIIIGVGGILAAVVLVVLLFLYKMCQKKPPAVEYSEEKVNRSSQTKESVKLLSVKTATPFSDSKRMSSNQMESIEC